MEIKKITQYKCLKWPSHDKFLLANMCWPTLAFTRQTHVKSQHTPTRNMASVVQWHTRRVAASGLLLFYVFRRRNNKKRWRNRKVWVKPYIARNPSLGVYNTFVQEIRAEDKAAFKNCLRMDQACLDELLEMVRPLIQKQDTNMRQSIPAGETLALTLRYLATGECFFSCYASIFLLALRAKLCDPATTRNIPYLATLRPVLYINTLQ